MLKVRVVDKSSAQSQTRRQDQSLTVLRLCAPQNFTATVEISLAIFVMLIDCKLFVGRTYALVPSTWSLRRQSTVRRVLAVYPEDSRIKATNQGKKVYFRQCYQASTVVPGDNAIVG